MRPVPPLKMVTCVQRLRYSHAENETAQEIGCTGSNDCNLIAWTGFLDTVFRCLCGRWHATEFYEFPLLRNHPPRLFGPLLSIAIDR
jgi:hypothetical protein